MTPSRSMRALSTVAMMLLYGCAGPTTGDGHPAVAGAGPHALPPLEVETGLLHVHGLGVDPGDGTLYAATHSGLFRVPERGHAERIANRAQDTMGFAVVGPGHFIASGHPDAREDDVRPPLLGLIESEDAGVTWNRLSLHGEADFHDLEYVHGQVYGYDSTSRTFMVTKDKVEWQRRSQVSLRDFAIDPSQPDRVVATAVGGPIVSGDGGRTWSVLAGAPTLAVVAWDIPDGLFGVDVQGRVHRSRDSGRTWTEAGSVGGEPEALAVDAAAVYVAVDGKGIRVSHDGGKNFTVRYAERSP